MHLFSRTPCIGLLEVIKWKISNRKEIKNLIILEAYNSSIIIDCATYIENFIALYLTEVLNNHYYNLSNELLYNHLFDSVNKAQFQSSKELFKVLTQKELKDITEEKVLKGINHLFNLRNVITHGNEIHFESHQNKLGNEIKVQGKYNAIYEYFKEIKLVEKKYTDINDIDIFLTNKVTDYFIATTLDFVKDFRQFSSDTKIELVVDFLDFKADEIFK